jgi:hypothetical protein
VVSGRENHVGENLLPSRGATEGLDDAEMVQIHQARIRSMVDRLSKAATRHDRGEVAGSWRIVALVERELRSLIDG